MGVILLLLALSGDIETNPGPVGEFLVYAVCMVLSTLLFKFQFIRFIEMVMLTRCQGS